MTAPIIVGADGSPHTAEAIRWTAEHAPGLNAPVIVAYAFEPPVPILPSPTPTLPAPFDAQWQKDMRALLETEWCRPLTEADVEFEVRIVAGDPASALEELAAAEGASLVVVGRRGHNAIRDVFLGSVSKHLCRHAPCPVLVVPAAS